MLTGLRPGDLLRLTRANLTDDGIEIETSKTGKRLLIEWSEALCSAVKRAQAQAASKRLGHAQPKITERVYGRKAERAKPPH